MSVLLPFGFEGFSERRFGESDDGAGVTFGAAVVPADKLVVGFGGDGGSNGEVMGFVISGAGGGVTFVDGGARRQRAAVEVVGEAVNPRRFPDSIERGAEFVDADGGGQTAAVAISAASGIGVERPADEAEATIGGDGGADGKSVVWVG